MRLKKPRISMTFIAFIGLTFVGLVGLHIHKELAGSVANSTTSSLSGDRSLELDNAIDNRREYEMILSILQLIPLSPFSFSPQK